MLDHCVVMTQNDKLNFKHKLFEKNENLYTFYFSFLESK
jgi:hypothetical protein